MAQRVAMLALQPQGLSYNLQNPHKNLDMAAYACNPSICGKRQLDPRRSLAIMPFQHAGLSSVKDPISSA